MQIKNLHILVLSIFMLFLELFLIRWISTEVRIFAYVNNLVLLACFIGIGAGCYFSNKNINILWSFICLAILILAVNSDAFKKITDLLGGFSDSHIWYQVLRPNNIIPAVNGIILTIFMFAMLASVFVPLGQKLGDLFNTHSHIIIAYSFNVVGSIIGVWLFSLFSFFYVPPLGWFILSAIIGWLFIPKKRINIIIFIAVIIFSCTILLTSTGDFILTLWSPYQKLEVYPSIFGEERNIQNGYVVKVNNVNYMGLLNISEEFINKNFYFLHKSLRKLRKFNQYELPYMQNKL